jgi:hypothetical protein
MAMPRQHRILLLTTALWALACAVFAYLRISAFLQSDEVGDVYNKTWSFQLLVFAMTQLPFWLLGLAVVLCGEWLYLRRGPRSP